jgi:predicted benzoate:H+ symporter BenE
MPGCAARGGTVTGRGVSPWPVAAATASREDRAFRSSRMWLAALLVALAALIVGLLVCLVGGDLRRVPDALAKAVVLLALLALLAALVALPVVLRRRWTRLLAVTRHGLEPLGMSHTGCAYSDWMRAYEGVGLPPGRERTD